MEQCLINQQYADAIKKVQKLLDHELTEVDKVIKNRVQSREELIPIISEYIFSAGGKRIRPILTLLSAKLFNYNGKSHINLSAAIDLIHTATLLHDDVVDQSLLRRGKPTANQKWDNKTSVLVGDFLLSQAFCIMAQEGNLEVLKILSNASAIIAEGEVMQVESTANINTTRDRYIDIITAKTGALFAAACEVGGLVCNRSREELSALKNFGMGLGIAFQIMDDIIDYNSSEEFMGKDQGNDFKESKVTLPVILLYKEANYEEKIFISRVFSGSENNNHDFKSLLSLFDKYKIVEKTHEIATNFGKKAIEELSIIENSTTKELMINIVDFAISRKY